jgi:hypothetical protein
MYYNMYRQIDDLFDRVCKLEDEEFTVDVVDAEDLATFDEYAELPLPEITWTVIGPSQYITARRLERLGEQCRRRGLDPERAWRETDRSVLMEGLYVKVEEDGQVVRRYKYVRADFLTAVFAAEGALARPAH